VVVSTAVGEKRVHCKCGTCGEDFGRYPNREGVNAHFEAHPECISDYSNGITRERGLKIERPLIFYWVEDNNDA